jgi:hypothetical protein
MGSHSWRKRTICFMGHKLIYSCMDSRIYQYLHICFLNPSLSSTKKLLYLGLPVSHCHNPTQSQLKTVTYFSPRRGCSWVMKFCFTFFKKKKNWGTTSSPPYCFIFCWTKGGEFSTHANRGPRYLVHAG